MPPAARLALVLLVPLLAAGCWPGGASPMRCVAWDKQSNLAKPDRMSNSCDYPINVRYCLTPQSRAGFEAPVRCRRKRVEPGEGIATFHRARMARFHVDICRPPAQPVREGNTFECR